MYTSQGRARKATEGELAHRAVLLLTRPTAHLPAVLHAWVPLMGQQRQLRPEGRGQRQRYPPFCFLLFFTPSIRREVSVVSMVAFATLLCWSVAANPGHVRLHFVRPTGYTPPSYHKGNSVVGRY